MYEYAASLSRVIDGDTVVMQIDLGFRVGVTQTFRLFGINAPEKRGSALTPEQRQQGVDATERLEELLTTLEPLVVITRKDRTGKFGRYLATIYGRDEDGPVNINNQMIRDGHAVSQEY